MSSIDWAKREVELACKQENPDREEGEFDYGCECYESALKAYKSLIEDRHSGFSFSITRVILNRLIRDLPLTPIIDSDDVWVLVAEDNVKKTYQCTRMSSLFKDVKGDGKIEYTDVNRYHCFDKNDINNTYTCGLGLKILDEYFPLELPYFPSAEKYKICMSDYLTDPKNGDYDTQAVWNIITPTGKTVEVNRYFGEFNGEFCEIDKVSFDKRVKLHAKRIQNLKEKEK